MNPAAADPARDCTFRARLRSGVWSVTKNEHFYGDYLSRAEAVRGACFAARAVEALGGSARVLLGPDGSLVPHHDLIQKP